jgi:hypothetical protein
LVSANLLRLRRISIEDAMGIRNTTPEIEAVAEPVNEFETVLA